MVIIRKCNVDYQFFLSKLSITSVRDHFNQDQWPGHECLFLQLLKLHKEWSVAKIIIYTIWCHCSNNWMILISKARVLIFWHMSHPSNQEGKHHRVKSLLVKSSAAQEPRWLRQLCAEDNQHVNEDFPGEDFSLHSSPGVFQTIHIHSNPCQLGHMWTSRKHTHTYASLWLFIYLLQMTRDKLWVFL